MDRPRRILGLQLKRLGDIILTTPAMAMLQDAFPEAEVDLMVDAKLAGFGHFVTGCRLISAPTGLLDYAKLARADYDVVMDFTGQDRCLAAAVISGARRKVTFRKYFKKPGRSFFFQEVVKSSLRNRHVTDHLADLSRQVGATGSVGRPPLRTLPEDKASAFQKLKAAGFPSSIETPYILLHPGTARPEKFWSAQSWGHVIDFITKRTGLRVVLTASPDRQEKEHLAAVAAATRSPTVQLSGTLNLGEFLAIIEGARMLACVDSAPVHMADALNTPLLALYGPTDPKEWGPRFSPCEIVHGSSNSEAIGSMSNISETTVISRLDDFLDRLETDHSLT